MDFWGFSDFFSGFSGGFQGDFQGNFRWISVAVSGGSQIVFRRFSVPLNQIVIPFRRYSEHKSPIVRLERRGHCTRELKKDGSKLSVLFPMQI